MRVVTDAEVAALLTPAVAVDAARRAVVDSWHGSLISPSRFHAEAGAVNLVFTVGGYADGPAGFRAYGTWPGASDQLVAVWSAAGELQVVVVGEQLGIRRTGALGAVAADVLARADARVVGVIGSGRQAWSQLWALASVRPVGAVRVFSPAREHRERYARLAGRELRLDAEAVGCPKDAVTGTDIVVLATASAIPVIESDWVSDGTHVTTLGPKLASAHETPPALADRARVLASDSPAQAAAYGEPFFTGRALVHLGSLLDGTATGRADPGDITVYCSTGLAGSEVVIAQALADLLAETRG
jgi:alanine dehydrogenase